MKTKQASAPRKTGNQVVEEKVQAANTYLKNADLSLVYEALEKNKKAEAQQRTSAQYLT
jgi:hypothetical protein